MRINLFMVALCFVLCNVKTEAQFGGGTGIAGDPYQIHNITHLENFTTAYQDDPFILMNNIDDSLRTHRFNGGMTGSYYGTFDGNGKYITLALNPSNQSAGFQSTGFIGTLANGGVVKNLIVKGYVASNLHGGGVVGNINE